MAASLQRVRRVGHPLRLYEPNVVYEVTSNVIQGRHLLRPSKQANELIAGVIGRAQELYPNVCLYGVSVLSTHVTWMLSSPTPADIPAFLGFVNGNTSREIGRLHDWPGTMWERRPRPIPIVDEASMVGRLEYLLAQGTKEGLVASPRDWPGVSCADALRRKRALRGTWFDRDLAYKARRRGERPGPYDFAKAYSVRFEKLPCWETCSDEEYAKRIDGLIRSIEHKAGIAREGRPVLGIKKVLAVDPHARSGDRERTPAPLCHAATRRARDEYRARYRAFVDAFCRAAERMRGGLEAVAFPLWCFPPPPPFVASSA